MEAVQTQENNIDLTRGHKAFESKSKNIEGIFTKLNGILDTTKYQEEYAQILKDLKRDPSMSTKMLSENMQMDYEGFVYDKYSDRLDKLTKKLESDALPFYEIHLLCNKIKSNLVNISGENIHIVIEYTRTLVNALNRLNTHNGKEKNKIIKEAYKTIYSVIMYEELFDRSDIFDYVKKLNIPVNIENLGRLLHEDLKMLDKQDLIDEDLKSLKTEGLGYDYLDRNIIKKVSNKTVGEVNSEYQERKRRTIEDLNEKVSNLDDSKQNIGYDLDKNKSKLKDLYKRKRILVSKMMSLLLVPVVTISAGYGIGKASSEKITEYKTITRTVDANTGKLVGEVEEIYDEHATTYVATVIEEGPWKVNRNGGYTRTVIAYEYKTPENAEEGYRASTSEIEKNITEKYRYVEAKDVLEETDSTTDSTILITETYQDKSVSRKSSKYTVPFTITAAVISLLFDLAVLLVPALGYEEAKRRLNNLNEAIESRKYDQDEIMKRIEKLKEYAVEVNKEYNEAVMKYGELGHKFVFDEIDTKSITDFPTKVLSKSRK